MTDRIEIRALRVLGTHGVLPEEQARSQPFELDIDIETDLAPAAVSDAVADTVDYGAAVELARRVVETQRFALMETMAARVAEVLLADVRASAVTVTVRKLRPPVAADLASAGVTIRRSRAE
ncbi:MAG TPA: dihydroneopterin aldolase [Acidimicrobiales bacterium]|nr:dihydroneopterin aldolase [Acidimicrobiales bacterium]